MIVLAYFVFAALMFPFVWRRAFIQMHDPRYSSDRACDAGMAAMPAFGIALFWPLALIVIPMYLWVVRPTPKEIREVQKTEERELRIKAQQMGLPWEELR